ncbi:uncharacterized protein [Oryza sativa Japonica Group]|uniref:Os02g0761300 protein n=2 Tax=Oryza sativa subsp. japonica TaxID=39947 RepID=A0A0P0VQ43_ORYSJ|nr:uncharacterized protein LOC9271812 [Oryza sativa Japonica Group]KAB8089019.1 hypothetical protein EE612_013825 [Oryza sativa]EAZ24703.1 hypothetical protein OsJ_08474 [Oryza sativa Japonica Group]KAF2947076.1 hypothetical protein DAI22_02g342200 [Oryza sativa Japonica Group]BAD17202.1 hypothetical protein [Oryza sativa Japonica Group]BAH91885.1 Os02g0761300 [Oryza sativa Japonica Group]|eukprot:NP_001173156.1 Os02g0761300 [Oryza sativa Japonica Group]
MELTTALPASPPPPPPQEDFRFDGPAFSAFPEGVASAGTNPFFSADAMDSNPFLATAVTAPPSPNPFELNHQSASPGAADPFDLFQHFTSAPASPARAAAIYAQFDGGVGDGNGADHDMAVVGDDDDDFQPRASYSSGTATSTVPFDWEEKPGKPKPKSELATCAAAATSANVGEVDDADFDFGVLLDKSVQVPELTTADELFDKGKIRPLKPPPGLLDGGSVASSPRSPISKSPMWSPRLRGKVGSGVDFDPFSTALAKAAKGPSPLGAGAKDTADAGTASSPKKPDPVSVTSPRCIPPATMINGGRKKWRLSDMLLFRRSAAKARAAGANISKEPVFKYSPVQQLGTPVKKATAGQSAAANGDVSAGKHKKQSKKATAAEDGMASPHRQSVMGCVRLNPGLHRLAKGFNGSSLHFGHRRAAARSVMNR